MKPNKRGGNKIVLQNYNGSFTGICKYNGRRIFY